MYPYCPCIQYIPYHSPVYLPIRQYPAVDANFLYQSANESKKLMGEASIVLDKLADSGEFDQELMQAAQASDLKEVKRLVHSIEGITSVIDVDYTPDGLRLKFKSEAEQLHCCQLLISLCWR